MKNKTIQLVGAFTALFVSAQLSIAQSSGSQSSRQSRSSSARTGLHASKLIGTEVKSSSGTNCGKLEDIIIDPQSSRAKFAIIARRGQGTGEKRVPVPWQALSISSDQDVTLNVDPQKMESAPTVSSEDTSELDNPEFVIVVYRFYAVPAGAGGAESPGGSQGGPGSSSSSNPNSSSDSSSQPNSTSPRP